MSNEVQTAYEKLRRAQRAQPFPSVAEREDGLRRLERLLVRRREDFVRSIDADFGGRCRHETLLADVVLTLDGARHARKHVRSWARPRAVAPSVYFLPSTAYVEPLPKGVVGVIAPWNYPVNLALAPLAAALAAGNRVLVKPSELTPHTSRLIADAIRETFTAEEVAVVEGGPDVAQAVTELPLDHLFFTGSTAVGRKVAAAAAKNLVPVTLELGGKSPALVHPDYPIEQAAERVALGKLFNAGQTCIAPDYALIPQGKEDAFWAAFKRTAVRATADVNASASAYTAMASDRGFERMNALVEEARAQGARVERADAPGAPGARRLAPVVLFNVPESARVMQEEVFGPLLPVKTYRTWDEALDHVRDRPRPLALYLFDEDLRRAEQTLRTLPSGGACLNDTLVHFAQEALPFGGVGASGMGAYHGRWGFETFSHLRSVLTASPLSPARRLQSPPYGKVLDLALRWGWFR